MTAQDVILKIESLSREERAQVEAWLRAHDAMREDALDLAILDQRQNESARDFRAALSELKIKAE
jgi:hypothetical protein